LSHAVPANISKLKVHCTDQETLDSLVLWLGHNSTSLTHLTQCDLSFEYEADNFHGETNAVLKPLPCPQLCQLHLQILQLQLEATGGEPGLLHACTALTALQLQDCRVLVTPEATAALAALSQLRSLTLARVRGNVCSYPSVAELLPGLSKGLTHLNLSFIRGWEFLMMWWSGS
jgi:hypothetical protein